MKCKILPHLQTAIVSMGRWTTLRWKWHHDDEIFITSCSHNDDISVSVMLKYNFCKIWHPPSQLTCESLLSQEGPSWERRHSQVSWCSWPAWFLIQNLCDGIPHFIFLYSTFDCLQCNKYFQNVPQNLHMTTNLNAHASHVCGSLQWAFSHR